MHVKDEHPGLVMLDQTGQDDAGEKGFAGAGGAKDAGGALDKLLQVQADRQALLAGVADDEIAFFLGVAKNCCHVACLGPPHLGMVGWHGLDRDGGGIFHVLLAPGGITRAARIGADLEHQRGHDFQVGIERLPVKQRRQAAREGASRSVRRQTAGRWRRAGDR